MGKLTKEERKNYQIVSRILGVLLRIGSVFCWIGVVGVVIAAIASAVVAPNVKVDKDSKEITLFDKTSSYTIKDKSLEFGDDENGRVIIKDNTISVVDKGSDVLSVKISDKSLEEIEKFIENDMMKLLAVLPFVLVLVAVLVALYAITLGHGARILKNIANDETPFAKDNIDRTEKAFKYMLAGIVLAFAVDMILTFASGLKASFNLEMTSITTVLGLYVLVYIFKAGYHLSDGKAEKAEKAEKADKK
ncbi:hypothetical protein J6W91_02910 [Candidatus Saccharibacteria bacterium]|nr:hypothetical protein [Candidatus Saccharibacteria bacterium]